MKVVFKTNIHLSENNDKEVVVFLSRNAIPFVDLYPGTDEIAI